MAISHVVKVAFCVAANILPPAVGVPPAAFSTKSAPRATRKKSGNRSWERENARKKELSRIASCGAVAAAAVLALTASASAQWKPTKTVEFIVPAGTGGGADQMARTLQGVIQKNELMDQSLVVLNKSGGAGGEGFLDVKGSAGNPHKIIITLSNLFTKPLSTGIPFTWTDITPVAMLALDEFVLWVNSESPYKTAGDYVDALKASKPNEFKMA